MIKAIVLDFGGVIYKTKWKEVNDFFFKKNGFDILVGNSNNKELIQIYNESDIGKEDFKRFFLVSNPNISDINKVVEDYKEGYAKFKILNEKLLKIIQDIKTKGIKLFGFSDIKKEHFEANKESGIYNGFEKIFTSFEFGCLKSNEKAFELLIKELKSYELNPEECLFIDDNIENVKRAEEKGFNVIHYDDFPRIKRIKKKLKEFFSF